MPRGPRGRAAGGPARVHPPRGGRGAAGDRAAAGPPGPLRKTVEEAERAAILHALEYTGGNRRKAIELLQISPETFYRRLEEFGLHKKGE